MIDIIAENSGIIGLLMFFTFFVGTAIMLWLPGAKAKYKDFGDMPFRKDKKDDK